MPKKASKILPKLWLVEFQTPYEFIAFYLEALEQFCNGIRSYETFEDSGIWMISMSFNKKPKMADLKAKVLNLSSAIKLPAPKLQLKEIENKNWVKELSKNFKPIRAGKFYIYSEFSKPSDDLINIKINPGMAFGTGQHETTYLCLEALQFLADTPLLVSPLLRGEVGGGFKPDNILDLGCGSGILAIAAAKVWNDTVTATDNDWVAVKVADENAVMNKVPLECFVSEGFKIFKTYKEVKFDLVFANILMNPLLEMAEDMAEFANGKVVLSGFKTEQMERIIEKYSTLGFKSERIFVKNHWIAALLTK